MALNVKRLLISRIASTSKSLHLFDGMPGALMFEILKYLDDFIQTKNHPIKSPYQTFDMCPVDHIKKLGAVCKMFEIYCKKYMSQTSELKVSYTNFNGSNEILFTGLNALWADRCNANTISLIFTLHQWQYLLNRISIYIWTKKSLIDHERVLRLNIFITSGNLPEEDFIDCQSAFMEKDSIRLIEAKLIRESNLREIGLNTIGPIHPLAISVCRDLIARELEDLEEDIKIVHAITNVPLINLNKEKGGDFNFCATCGRMGIYGNYQCSIDCKSRAITCTECMLQHDSDGKIGDICSRCDQLIHPECIVRIEGECTNKNDFCRLTEKIFESGLISTSKSISEIKYCRGCKSHIYDENRDCPVHFYICGRCHKKPQGEELDFALRYHKKMLELMQIKNSFMKANNHSDHICCKEQINKFCCIQCTNANDI